MDSVRLCLREPLVPDGIEGSAADGCDSLLDVREDIEREDLVDVEDVVDLDFGLVVTPFFRRISLL